ncbi:MAG: hypothetical protein JSV13_08525 [Nitrospiraceae bacterium]|nr:MAG: hypothetical protein JSV13_08525 [Nitrospiraceae bacterium]
MDTVKDYRYFRKSGSQEDPVTRTALRNEPFCEEKQGQFILCIQCVCRITSIDHIIAINGAHRHSFTNPAGYFYEIACFSSAVGCAIARMSTFEYTLFKGYCWRLVFCSTCSLHLGWFYQSNKDHFFGLVRNRLIDDSVYH